MHAIFVQLDYVHMIAAVLVAFLVLDDDEERIRRYGAGSAHVCRNGKMLDLITEQAVEFK